MSQDQLKSCSETEFVSPNKLPETVPQDLLTAPAGYTSTELTDPVSTQSSVSPTPVSISTLPGENKATPAEVFIVSIY